jgi:hypothetical protein
MPTMRMHVSEEAVRLVELEVAEEGGAAPSAAGLQRRVDRKVAELVESLDTWLTYTYEDGQVDGLGGVGINLIIQSLGLSHPPTVSQVGSILEVLS